MRGNGIDAQMRGAAPIEADAPRWLVRRADERDLDGVGVAVEELLLELGGKPPSPSALRDTALALIGGESLGVLLVAESAQGEADGRRGEPDGGRGAAGVARGEVGIARGEADGARGDIVGLLGVSWQTAVRIPGRYGLIQELWVHPSWRGREIGAELLDALRDVAREGGIARIEVGLPSERFPQLEATEAFYRANGFEPVGMRMKLLLDDGREEL
jgi:GNAT superfamily N-acetyltransferase